jgi:hypothetical protein
MLPNYIAIKFLECIGLPSNLQIVFTEVSHHFSYFENLSVDKVDIEPCVLLIRESNHTNGIFTIGCNQRQIDFVKKHFDSAELYVDSFTNPQSNWKVKISLLLNNDCFDIQIVFDIDLKNKSYNIIKTESDIDEKSLVQLVMFNSVL